MYKIKRLQQRSVLQWDALRLGAAALPHLAGGLFLLKGHGLVHVTDGALLEARAGQPASVRGRGWRGASGAAPPHDGALTLSVGIARSSNVICWLGSSSVVLPPYVRISRSSSVGLAADSLAAWTEKGAMLSACGKDRDTVRCRLSLPGEP